MFKIGDKIRLKNNKRPTKCPLEGGKCHRGVGVIYPVGDIDQKSRTWRWECYTMPLDCFDCFELVERDGKLTTKEVSLFKIGDKVKFIKPCHPTCGVCGDYLYKVGKVIVTNEPGISVELENGRKMIDWDYNHFELVEENKNQQTTKEVAMNETIAKTYELTADAVLVNRWFGGTLTSHFYAMLLSFHATEFLAEAKRLEAEEKARQK